VGKKISKKPIVAEYRLGIIIAIILFLMSVLRLPAGIGQSRDIIRIIIETGILLALGFFVVYKGNKWIGFFALLAVFSFFYPLADENALLTRNSVFFGIVWYMIIVLVFNKNTVKFLMWAMCGIAFVHTIFLIYQHFGLDPYGTFTFGFMKSTMSGNPTGLMTMSNEASGLLAITASAFLINRYLRWGLIIIAIGLFVTKDAGGMIAVYVGLGFYLFFSGLSYRIIIGCIIVSLLAVIEYVQRCKILSIIGRVDIWKVGWEYYKEYWILGYGLGHWKLVTKQLHAHNDFFQVLFEMGIGAWILIAGYLTNIFKRFTKEALISTTALIVILVHSCYSWLWCIGVTAIVQVTWLAILEIQLRECSQQVKVRKKRRKKCQRM